MKYEILEDGFIDSYINEVANDIRRENFKNPQRQDEYGTSVISLQFTRGKKQTLSIKNRYNHSVS